MRLRVDIGVHAQAHARSATVRVRHLSEPFELVFAFDVEAQHADLERARHFRARLANAGKDDAGRVAAGGQHALELAAGDDVEAAAVAREPLQNGEIRVGLHRVADQMLAAFERLLVRRERALHRPRRVDIEWRAEASREVGGGDAFDEEAAILQGYVRRAGQARHGSATGGPGVTAEAGAVTVGGAFLDSSGPF